MEDQSCIALIITYDAIDDFGTKVVSMDRKSQFAYTFFVEKSCESQLPKVAADKRQRRS